MPAKTQDARLVAGNVRRAAILKFVKAYIRRNGISPSVEEVTQGVELASKSVTIYHLDKLEEQGKITRQRGKFRSIRVLEPKRG